MSLQLIAGEFEVEQEWKEKTALLNEAVAITHFFIQ